MQNFHVILTDRAKADLVDIVGYLNKFSVETGTKYVKLIYKKMNALKTFPRACPLVRIERLRKYGIRWTVARNYAIFFTIDEENSIVYIERIMYSRREYDALL